MFSINFLDHVSIQVNDVKASVVWYEKHFGLKHVFEDTWNFCPAMMVAGNTGIAIFPTKIPNGPLPTRQTHRYIDHFAFNVSSEDFEKAKVYFKSEGIDFRYGDHTVTESIYINDPDGHVVELTTVK